MSPDKKKQIAKWIVVFGALFWVGAGTWGVISCLETAKDLKNRHVSDLQLSRLTTAHPSRLPNEKTVIEQIQILGLDRTPYLFTAPLLRSMLVFALCVIVSLFVLYAALILDAQDYAIRGRHARGDGVYIVR